MLMFKDIFENPDIFCIVCKKLRLSYDNRLTVLRQIRFHEMVASVRLYFCHATTCYYFKGVELKF